MNVLQFTKHKSTSTLRLCDVDSEEIKLTVIIVYCGVISHWTPKSFDNRSFYASVISLLIFFGPQFLKCHYFSVIASREYCNTVNKSPYLSSTVHVLEFVLVALILRTKSEM